MYLCSCVKMLVFVSCFNYVACDLNVTQIFESDSEVSKVVLKAPIQFIAVNYSNTKIVLGTIVEPLQTLEQPEISYNASNCDLCTLILIGPDLPPSTTPPLTQVVHWLVINIPGQEVTKGDPVATYFSPTPYGEGFTYIFLLLKQNGTIDKEQVGNMSSFLSRLHFSFDDFSKKYNLGDPMAGNFMRESYVAIVDQALQTAYSALISAVELSGIVLESLK